MLILQVADRTGPPVGTDDRSFAQAVYREENVSEGSCEKGGVEQ